MFRGIAGLNSTAADYYQFAQRIANGGELNGRRLLGRMTVDNMITNHIGSDKSVYIHGEGYGFGLGFGVLTNLTQAVIGSLADQKPRIMGRPTPH